MTLSAALQGTFKEMRKDNTVGISVQTCSDIFDSNVPPAYVFWLYPARKGETLPRGRFFRKRKPIINVMAKIKALASEK
ncbi:hypothetical protein [Klebsiella quasipneumoniae]|uniref:hypothetical protein n=1 Tax=Klebsiella quasipneumoniae TaxID=1463165 RepID=UPI002201D52A|nr:hypothetical protein [Klebsiella quasipneumoniae]BDO05967.1 hypothetical protein KAM622c_55540 [Klebsiella quasipneumoniae subsp. quasipneumoniae]